MDIIQGKTLSTSLAGLAENIGERPCFICNDDSISFAQMKKNAIKTAGRLLEEGVKKSSRVALLSKDNLNCYEIFFACALSKSVMVAVNWRLQPDEVHYILEHSEAEILFVGESLFPLINNIADKLPNLRKIIAITEPDRTEAENKNSLAGHYPEFHHWRDQAAEQAERTIVNLIDSNQYNEDDAVVQMYTSGTTGHPKGVELAHYTFFHLMQGMQAQGDVWMDLNSEDKLLLALPIFHIGGLWWAVQGFLAGACGVITPFFSGRSALKLMRDHKISKAALVPAMIQFLLAEPDCHKEDFRSLKGLLYGASPISPQLLNQAMEIFDCDFFQIYGMTETGNMAVCLRPEDHHPCDNKKFSDSEKIKAAGKALPGVEIKIVNQQNEPLAEAKIGEILLKSPSRMLRYWKNPEETDRVMQDGWVRTGDAGYLDKNGYLYICDRIKDMIIYASENIYPAQIEAVIAAHPAVQEVAVIGQPDERWGEIVKAVIVLKSEQKIKKREILDFLRGKIADFKLPKVIEFIDALPRNASGKVLKRQLRDSYRKKHESQSGNAVA